MTAVQLDLFGEVEAAEQTAAEETARAAVRAARYADLVAEWRARFEVGVYRLRNNVGGYTGGWRTGYRCPDPWCSEVASARDLARGHGFDPDTPGEATFDSRCNGVRSLQLMTHRLEDVEQIARGQYRAGCFCRDVLFTGASLDELDRQLAEHTAHWRQPKTVRAEWSTWTPGWNKRWMRFGE
ncbi:MAG TPA: hypothetical protein VGL36_35565 [Kribbella sp.]